MLEQADRMILATDPHRKGEAVTKQVWNGWAGAVVSESARCQ